MPARPRVEHVIDYRGPEPGTSAFKRVPFSGRRVEQRLESHILSGPLLVSQCQSKTTTGRRCRRTTTCDYQFCSFHLVRNFHLMVAPSRIPGAGLGVFAVKEATLRRLGKDTDGRPVGDDATVVFANGDSIGNGFGGEFLTEKAYDRRYDGDASAYALTWYTDAKKTKEGPGLIDGFLARTISSYCNDAVNLTGDPEWSFWNNAAWIQKGLTAEALVCHGDEIFWSYGAGYWTDHVPSEPDVYNSPDDPLQ